MDNPTASAMPTRLDFATDSGFGARAMIGLILLETDRTLEVEARRIQLDGVAFYHSRIENDAEVTAETLTAMAARLPAAAALLPSRFGFDAIGYGCTSAATLIGEDAVAAAIRTAHPDMACTNPVSAAVDAFRALGPQRLAILTPYSEAVTAPVVAHFESHGFVVDAVGSFLETDDLTVAMISEASIADGVRRLMSTCDVDAVFVSCTSLRTFGVIEALELELGVPVVSSNLALLWRLLRLAGIDDAVDGLGRLMRLPSPN